MMEQEKMEKSASMHNHVSAPSSKSGFSSPNASQRVLRETVEAESIGIDMGPHNHLVRSRSVSMPIAVAESVLSRPSLDQQQAPENTEEMHASSRDDSVPKSIETPTESVVNMSEVEVPREPPPSHSPRDADTQLIEEEFSKVNVPISRKSAVEGHVRRYLRGVHEPELEDYYFSDWIVLRFTLASLYFKLRSFLSILITFNMLLNVGVAVGGTVFCIAFNLVTDLPLSLISIAVVFPISFGIQNNFGRREVSLREVAVLRSLALSMFLGARDWCDQSERQFQEVKKLRTALSVALACMRQTMLHNTPPGGSAQVYKAIDNLALHLSTLNASDKGMLNNPSIYSRLCQFLRQFIESWERLRVIHDYRTPSSLRSFALVWLFLVSMVLAPLFAKYSRDFGYMSGVYCAIICSVIMSGLHQIFQNEEDPFDGSGVDDLSLDPLSLMTNFMYDKPTVLRQRLHVMDHGKARKHPHAKKPSESRPSVFDAPTKRRFDAYPKEKKFSHFSDPALFTDSVPDPIRTANPRFASHDTPFLFFQENDE